MFINKIYLHMDIDLEIGVDLQKESNNKYNNNKSASDEHWNKEIKKVTRECSWPT